MNPNFVTRPQLERLAVKKCNKQMYAVLRKKVAAPIMKGKL
jgi:hypothetical protein